MEFQLEDAVPVLRRTPAVLRVLLRDLPGPWIGATEGPGTWSPFDVVGHLIHADRTDWMPRVEHLLRHGDAADGPARLSAAAVALRPAAESFQQDPRASPR